ncbi:putative short-chain dehydrogenase/reductase family 42E member 2 [Petromyzon marinus]|uniref:putative short-chain dehydrogenase/reductase family 42E member 2 n=1 Tax=Petromyzon marinus TaxID=7757 RepID=UPI003F716DF2
MYGRAHEWPSPPSCEGELDEGQGLARLPGAAAVAACPQLEARRRGRRCGCPEARAVGRRPSLPRGADEGRKSTPTREPDSHRSGRAAGSCGDRRGHPVAPVPFAIPPRGPATPERAWPATPRPTALVTGGTGYFGWRLGAALSGRGFRVRLLDVRSPPEPLPAGASFVRLSHHGETSSRTKHDSNANGAVGADWFGDPTVSRVLWRTQADVRDYEAVAKACSGVACVFHTASCGMSGSEQLNKVEVESVNVLGTQVVIAACVACGVPSVVYTSTVNVVFHGEPIHQGDEQARYVPLNKFVDHYSRTKTIADQMVLLAHGTPLEGGGLLRTCVLRPPGIYGPGEPRHIPRVATNIRRRLFSFRFGSPDVRINWVHVENLAEAHVLAACALAASGTAPPPHGAVRAIERSAKAPRSGLCCMRRVSSVTLYCSLLNFVGSRVLCSGCIVRVCVRVSLCACAQGGQAYFINDGEEVNVFQWLQPLFEKLGHSMPRTCVPVHLVYAAALAMEWVHLLLRPLVDLPPLLTRSEVWNVGVTHTFCISKARRQLGYRPRKFCLSETLDVPKITRIKTWQTGVARHEALMWTGVLLCFCLFVLHSVVLLLMMF